MKNFVKYFLIIWFSIAFLCSAFGQCEYEVKTDEMILTEYQTVFMDLRRVVHLSLIQVGGSVALEVAYVRTTVNAPFELCLDQWSSLTLILSDGPVMVIPFIGNDTCSAVYDQPDGSYKQYVTGIYELDEQQLAILEKNQVDSLIMFFVTEVTVFPLLEKLKRPSKGCVTYGQRKFNGKQYFTNQIPCLTWKKYNTSKTLR